jgi:MarR family 2-MHQ and catechol resistance regulon transcriptional repressor
VPAATRRTRSRVHQRCQGLPTTGLCTDTGQGLVVIGQSLTQRRLAGELYVSFANVTVLLGRLERKGLIQRTANVQDRREKFVRLTPRGRTLLRRIWGVHQRQLERVMTGLTAAEQDELASLLNKMSAAHAPTRPQTKQHHRPPQEILPC